MAKGNIDDSLTVRSPTSEIGIPSPEFGRRSPEFGGGPISITSTQRKKRDLQQIGLYAQDQMRIDRWHLMAGLRNDWVDTANTDRDTGSTSEYADTQISGRAGVLYRLDNGAAPYMSYSTSFSPNSTTDMNGDLLDPTEGEQVEAGVKFQLVGTRDRYTAAVFHITQEELDRVALLLNQRPRKTLGYHTPADILQVTVAPTH